MNDLVEAQELNWSPEDAARIASRTATTEWWNDGIVPPKGFIIKERFFEGGKISSVIMCDLLGMKWVSYSLTDEGLKKQKTGKTFEEVAPVFSCEKQKKTTIKKK